MEPCEGGCGTLVDVRAGQYFCGACDVDPETLAILEAESAYELEVQDEYETMIYREELERYISDYCDV